MDNFEVYTANGQYRKVFIDSCFKELERAVALQAIAPLTPCQAFVLDALQDEFQKYLKEAADANNS